MKIVEVPPNSTKWPMPGIRIANDTQKYLYVRVGLKSMKVSDRKPAKYGLKSNAEVV